MMIKRIQVSLFIGYPKVFEDEYKFECDSVWYVEDSYWLACPSNEGSSYFPEVRYVAGGSVNSVYPYTQYRGLRPVICLNHNVELKDVNGVYEIYK